MDKQKVKIKKLLELSLSDNENEAGIALRQAMSLMNKHNITKDEVYGQNMENRVITTPYYRIPDWYAALHHLMAKVSGCFCVYKNGSAQHEKLATIQITGRQRDVANAEYLIVFLAREIEKSVQAYPKQLFKKGIVQRINTHIKSYRIGFIDKIYQRMYTCQNQFFTAKSRSQSKNNEVVCVDVESRINEAQHYYRNELGQRFSQRKSQTRYVKSSLDDGYDAADKLEINPAVHRQTKFNRLSYM